MPPLSSAEETTEVAVIGTGAVGSAYAFALTLSGLARRILLLDKNRDRAEGEAVDLTHGAPFARPCEVRAADYPDISNTDLIVICAGVPQRPGETRMDLLRRNLEVFRDVTQRICEHNEHGIILVVTNPVDVLTYATLRFSNRSKKSIIGSGTVLDSARFRSLLARHCGVDARNVHGYVVGEHGDSEVILWSKATIAGTLIIDHSPLIGRAIDDSVRRRIEDDVRQAAYRIIEKKGYTSTAVAMSLLRITESVLRDQCSILTISRLVEDYYGIRDVCLSLPTVVGREGCVSPVMITLTDEEISLVRRSAGIIRQALDDVGIL